MWVFLLQGGGEFEFHTIISQERARVRVSVCALKYTSPPNLACVAIYGKWALWCEPFQPMRMQHGDGGGRRGGSVCTRCKVNVYACMCVCVCLGVVCGGREPPSRLLFENE